MYKVEVRSQSKLFYVLKLYYYIYKVDTQSIKIILSLEAVLLHVSMLCAVNVLEAVLLHV